MKIKLWYIFDHIHWPIALGANVPSSHFTAHEPKVTNLFQLELIFVIKFIMYKITAKLLVVCTMYNSVYIVPVVDMDSGHAALLEQIDICLQFTCTLSDKVRFYTVDLQV